MILNIEYTINIGNNQQGGPEMKYLKNGEQALKEINAQKELIYGWSIDLELLSMRLDGNSSKNKDIYNLEYKIIINGNNKYNSHSFWLHSTSRIEVIKKTIIERIHQIYKMNPRLLTQSELCDIAHRERREEQLQCPKYQEILRKRAEERAIIQKSIEKELKFKSILVKKTCGTTGSGTGVEWLFLSHREFRQLKRDFRSEYIHEQCWTRYDFEIYDRWDDAICAIDANDILTCFDSNIIQAVMKQESATEKQSKILIMREILTDEEKCSEEDLLLEAAEREDFGIFSSVRELKESLGNIEK